MRYASAAAFRQALEARFVALSRDDGVPLVRLRKSVAFDRLLARLFAVAPDRWVLKGGLALDYRLGTKTRTTMDIDLAGPGGGQDAATTGCLVRDRDAKCSGSCDAVLRSVGMRVTGDRDDATPSASTGRSSRGGAILTGRSGPMASTTTAGDPIAPSAWLHRWQRPGSPCRSVRGIVAAGTCSAA